jgi:hypothetical protein
MTTNLIIHLSILAVLVLGVAYIGKKMWDEMYPEFKEWLENKER